MEFWAFCEYTPPWEVCTSILALGERPVLRPQLLHRRGSYKYFPREHDQLEVPQAGSNRCHSTGAAGGSRGIRTMGPDLQMLSAHWSNHDWGRIANHLHAPPLPTNGSLSSLLFVAYHPSSPARCALCSSCLHGRSRKDAARGRRHRQRNVVRCRGRTGTKHFRPADRNGRLQAHRRHLLQQQLYIQDRRGPRQHVTFVSSVFRG